MPQANSRPEALLEKYNLSIRGRITRVGGYKKPPREKLIDSFKNQIEIVHILREGREPKGEGIKERRMFYEEDGHYVVQAKYANNPLKLTPDADTVEVGTLEELKGLMEDFITLAKAGYFDEQVNRIASDWASKRVGKRGPRKPKTESEQAA